MFQAVEGFACFTSHEGVPQVSAGLTDPRLGVWGFKASGSSLLRLRALGHIQGLGCCHATVPSALLRQGMLQFWVAFTCCSFSI